VSANAIKLFESLQQSFEDAVARKDREALPLTELFADLDLVESRLSAGDASRRARARQRSRLPAPSPANLAPISRLIASAASPPSR
jgi:hypothetical protein